ncbi:hypothetical protein NIES37_67450 [Tolypothrix tenuis PCC 7101]|uniref:Uncharacterized protein n=1 Tax=Tolypothrix tenuis PCC 7101 TaxID=231146 RepID=A0A1Z4NAN4_9CYAN|nr:hypothetical protein NIES37_67450 [Tolypothrix tenuis PCC 7101]BAZ78375.1 hypothetical protein NIES50_70080 [Aulosira laxa NIES-50]
MTWRRWLDVGCSKNQKSPTLSATLINLAELEINFSYGRPAFDRFPIDL